MPKRRKYHPECQHKNFGRYCHKCKPDRSEAMLEAVVALRKEDRK